MTKKPKAIPPDVVAAAYVELTVAIAHLEEQIQDCRGMLIALLGAPAGWTVWAKRPDDCKMPRTTRERMNP